MNSFNLKANKFLKNYKFELFSAIIFILFSLIHYWNLGFDYYKDNWGVDQASIERIAENIISGVPLNKDSWRHGIGYGLVISPFLFLANPFNAAGFFLFTTTFTNIFKNIDSILKEKKQVMFFIILISISIIFSPDMKYWVIGCSNTLSSILILISVIWSISPKVPKNVPIFLGILSGFVFSSRYLDYLLLFPLYFTAIFNYCLIHKKDLKKNLFLGFSISFIFIFITFLLHKLFLGDFLSTPYDTHINQGARLSNLADKDSLTAQFSNRYFSWIIPNLYSTFINYKSFASELTVKGAKTALEISPILIFAPFSILNFINNLFSTKQTLIIKKIQKVSLASFISLIIWIILYASRWASTAHDLYWYALRFYMGWISLIIFITLYGLTLKPKFKVIFLSVILYVILISYPSYYVKNEFKNNEIIQNLDVFEAKNSNISKKFNLPIPFNEGRKSLLFMNDNGEIIAVDNFTNNLILGQCKLNNFNIDLSDNKFRNCNYIDSNSRYYPENGMEFLNIIKLDDSYEVDYKIFEDGGLLLKKLVFRNSDTEIEDNGSVKLILDSKDRYKIINKGRTFYAKRNKNFYLNNYNNIYWPNWPLIGAETINSKNQIITSNTKDSVFCIWEVDRNWHYRKDRLCGSFGDPDIGKYEEEFELDINNDQFINKTLVKRVKNIKKIGDNSSKVIFKVNPIKFDENYIKIKTNKRYKNKLKLNIKLNRTGGVGYRNFPSLISLSCNEDFLNCSAYKIGRFNNLWSIWVKPLKSVNSLELTIDKISKDKPLFWPISYITVKN